MNVFSSMHVIQEHNNLVTIQRAKLKGTHELSESLWFVKLKIQMQTPTIMNKVFIEDYYHMTKIDENVNWIKPMHLLSIVSLNLEAPFCAFTFTLKKLIDILYIHTREK